jgi:hypothetical protein
MAINGLIYCGNSRQPQLMSSCDVRLQKYMVRVNGLWNLLWEIPLAAASWNNPQISRRELNQATRDRSYSIYYLYTIALTHNHREKI